jgi:hypothetical protein
MLKNVTVITSEQPTVSQNASLHSMVSVSTVQKNAIRYLNLLIGLRVIEGTVSWNCDDESGNFRSSQLTQSTAIEL